MAEPAGSAAAPWPARYARALQMLGADAADPLAHADALWLARVLPEPGPDAPAHAAPVPPVPAAPPPAAGPAPRPPRAAAPAPTDAAPADPPPDAALFIPQPGADGRASLAARRVPVPAADALPGRAAIERALKPFARRRPSRQHHAIDPLATADASARASAELLAAGARHLALVPVLRPRAERWFDVALLVEQDEAMQVFDDTLAELRRLLARHGGFGQVRLWRWTVRDGAVAVRTAAGAACAPHAMLQPQRPQIVLVCTHGASAHWHGEALRGFVRGLGRQAVLAIVQMLPAHGWAFTALGDALERVRAPTRAAPNLRLQRRDAWDGGYVDGLGLGAVPLLPLQPPALAAWARWVMAPRLLAHAAVALDGPAPEPPGPAPELPVRERVLRFRAIASEQAYALLRLLAASWVSLPLMRLLLHSLPGPRSVAPLAEVLLSGLLRRQSPAGTPAHETVFEFVPGVREWLHGALSHEELAQAEAAQAAAREAIRRFVEQQSGAARASFDALLADPAGLEQLSPAARSFVEVSRRLLTLRGSAAAPAAAAPPPAARPGRLFNFPPQACDLVARPALEEALAQRILALPAQGNLLLRARPGAGGRTLLAAVLRRPALAARFSGGIWFGASPPRRTPQAGDGPRLAVRFGPHAPGGDVRIELRWEHQGPVDIDHLSADESTAHLRAMGVLPERISELAPVHAGMPALVPLVGVGAVLGFTRWPAPLPGAPQERFAALAAHVLRLHDGPQLAALLDLAVRRPGFPAVPAPAAGLARRLGWLCPGGPGLGDTLDPQPARWLLAGDARATQEAHLRLAVLLRTAHAEARWRPYLRQHLLRHAEAAGGPALVQRMLLERPLVQLLLAQGPRRLAEQLTPWAQQDPPLAQAVQVLQAEGAREELPDAVRRPLAPPNPWADGIGAGAAWAQSLDGRGVRIAVVATGVDERHPELQHLRVGGAATDPNGHGTAVASVLAGRFIGIAPQAVLYSVAPLDEMGHASTDALLRALSELASSPMDTRADIVCLPLQTRRMSRPVQEMLQGMAAAGMLLVDAIGNEGGSGTGLPGPDWLLSAGALGRDGTPAGYSNRGADLWAPVGEVWVAVPVSDDALDAALYAQQRGTSYACAAVAGLAALVAQATGLRGGALRQRLLDMAGPDARAFFNPDAAGAPPLTAA